MKRNGLALAAVLAAVLAAGCTAPHGLPGGSETPGASPSPSSTGPPVPSAPHSMVIHGIVVDAALHPVAEARTRILETGASAQGAAFRFDGLDPGAYTLTASAKGFASHTLVVTPAESLAEVRFVLEADRSTQAYNVTVHVHGSMQCALEAGIISPSCDTLLAAEGHPVFTSNTTFTLLVDAGWRTVVGDVVFDPKNQPATNGLRVTVKGTSDQSELGVYQQYGRFNGTQPFTWRVEPGLSYPEGVKPVPENTTAFAIDVYPQSLGWHATCTAPVPSNPAPCLLGVGGGPDISFDLYLTIFYGQPAPAGYTLRH